MVEPVETIKIGKVKVKLYETSEVAMENYLKEAYKECKEIIRKEGIFLGAKCICDKIGSKEWQGKISIY